MRYYADHGRRLQMRYEVGTTVLADASSVSAFGVYRPEHFGPFGDPANWTACRSFFVCGGSNESLAGTAELKPDADRARALLKEAGYKGETLVFLSTHEIPWMGQMAEVVADELQRAGVRVDLVWSDWGTTSTR